MSVFDSEQKIGVELEFYCPDGEDGANTWLYENSYEDEIVCTGDGSLGNAGAEFKFNGGIELRNSQRYLDIMYEISENRDTEFNAIRNEFTGNEAYTEFECRGETGLHIHFGLPENVLSTDLLRLIKNVNKRQNEINQLAWRNSSEWGRGTAVHVPIINNHIFDAISSDSIIDSSHYSNKYVGVNFTNVLRGYNTVEFRFGHASLMRDKNAFESYLEALTDVFAESVTGERTMTWGDFRLTETGQLNTMTRSIDISRMKNDQVIGKLNYMM